MAPFADDIKFNESKQPTGNVALLRQTPQLISLFTIIRDINTPRGDFVFYSNRIIRLLVEEGLDHLPVEATSVQTPTGLSYDGVRFQGKICGVSIMRAGESMEQGLRDCCRSVRIGKILIQRNEENGEANFFYEKLPEDVADRYVLLLDPMLATGGSVIMAIKVLISKGVKPERILFLNLIATPEGLKAVGDAYPQVKIIVGFIDEGLNTNKFVSPGLGDFGDRYYCL
ncbi:uracil phosphoribosyltransferase [Dipodascopsis tothii]|uniref:uracil phosphoribosyltransferase n=1 Tax=Dipodascopsis tothii TaxID=44089 RepID=UPI0034CE3750